MNDEMRMESSYEVRTESESLTRYTAKTFGWMFLGLLLTFIVAIEGYMTGQIIRVLMIPYWHYLLLIAEIGVVVFLSARIEKMSVGTARVMFFLYAILNGIVFSAYFLIFDLAVLCMAFGLTALMFGIMALIGYFGNVNFTKLRPLMTGGLLFLAGYWLIGMFIDLSAYEMIVCTIGIFLFLVYTAYDTKKIRSYYVYFGQQPEMAAKASIMGALALYLDFVNLFLYLLRVLARKKD